MLSGFGDETRANGAGVGVGVGVGVGEALATGDGDALGTGDGDALGTGDGDALATGDGDALATVVAVGVGAGVGAACVTAISANQYGVFALNVNVPDGGAENVSVVPLSSAGPSNARFQSSRCC